MYAKPFVCRNLADSGSGLARKLLEKAELGLLPDCLTYTKGWRGSRAGPGLGTMLPRVQGYGIAQRVPGVEAGSGGEAGGADAESGAGGSWALPPGWAPDTPMLPGPHSMSLFLAPSGFLLTSKQR